MNTHIICKTFIWMLAGFILALTISASHAQESAPMSTTPKLTDTQNYVIWHGGTEKPFENEFWDHKEEGIYVDLVSGEPLFSSTDKFDSGTGWPSFTKPISDHGIKTAIDRKHGMTRTEVKSSGSDAHLGHVFDDGPKDKGGMRYCINSAALRFVPKAELESQGYGEYLPLFEKTEEVKNAAP